MDIKGQVRLYVHDNEVKTTKAERAETRVDFVLSDSASSTQPSTQPSTQHVVASTQHVVEVKNVVCAEYCAATAPVKRNLNHSVITRDFAIASFERAGLFPWGTITKQTFEGQPCVSERAIKHVRNMAALQDKGFRTTILFVANRGDCATMRACQEQDPAFTIARASASGVGVDCVRVRWEEDEKCYWHVQASWARIAILDALL